MSSLISKVRVFLGRRNAFSLSIFFWGGRGLGKGEVRVHFSASFGPSQALPYSLEHLIAHTQHVLQVNNIVCPLGVGEGSSFLYTVLSHDTVYATWTYGMYPVIQGFHSLSARSLTEQKEERGISLSQGICMLSEMVFHQPHGFHPQSSSMVLHQQGGT